MHAIKSILFAMLLVLMVGCTAQPAKTARVNETVTVAGTQVTLSIDPLQAGENRLVVTINGAATRAAEAHVVMTAMGHGQVVDLEQVAPDRYEVSTGAIEMEGAWMVRIKFTTVNNQEQTASFYLTVK